MHPDGDVRAATVGKPTPGTQVRISESGEILVAGESVFLGYYKNPEATAGRSRTGGSAPATPASSTSTATW